MSRFYHETEIYFKTYFAHGVAPSFTSCKRRVALCCTAGFQPASHSFRSAGCRVELGGTAECNSALRGPRPPACFRRASRYPRSYSITDQALVCNSLQRVSV